MFLGKIFLNYGQKLKFSGQILEIDHFNIALHVFISKGQVKEECTVRTHQRNPHATFSTASLLPSALHALHFNLCELFLIFSHQFFGQVNFMLYFPTSFWVIFEIELNIFFPHTFKLGNKFFQFTG